MNNGAGLIDKVVNNFRYLLSVIICIFVTIGFSGCSKVGEFDFYKDSPEAEKLSVANTAKGVQIANFAKQFLGVPYVYGGHNPSGFDCSGLVQYSHQRVGVNVPRTASIQYEMAQEISISEMRPGDVIFFRMGFWKTSHVGIYVGKGIFVHAPSSGKVVTLASLTSPYWRNRIEKIGRLYR